jgi:hypothetical protein
MRGSTNGKKTVFKSILAALAAFSSLAQAQTTNTTLEQQLEAKYTLTTPTADYTDIVTAGSTLILEKKGFSGGSVANKVPTTNVYKDGQIKSDLGSVIRTCKFCGSIPVVGSTAGAVVGAAGPSRGFVNNEKLYVTKISVDRSKDNIIFSLISDSYGDAGRYKGTLAFPFPKGSVGSADLAKVDAVISEVFKIAPAADQSAVSSKAAQQSTTATAEAPPAVATAPPDAPLPPIAPPPPPPAPEPVVETKAIDVGQTKEQVEAILGKPEKAFKVGSKEIYQYKDVKVTFVNGKMTDAQ